MADKNRRRVNIGEVARAAGVSKMTVSRMLNQSGKVAPATRARVQKVIDEFRYQPSLIARGLASQKTGIMGIMIFDRMDFDYLQTIFLGVEYEARCNGYDLLIFAHPEGNGGRGSRCLSLVDGVLCFGYDIDNDAIENLEDRGIPYAVLGKRDWRRAAPWSVRPNYIEGYRDTARYLLDLGHRRIAFLGGSAGFYADREKYEGYRLGLKDGGIPDGDTLILQDENAGRLRELMENFRPTAVFIEGPQLPLAFLMCVRDMGLKIPRDISVIYTRRDLIDSHTLYDLAGIHELTLLGVARQELGAAGVRLLRSLIDGERNMPKEQFMALEFNTGESCAPPPGAGNRPPVRGRAQKIKEEL